MDSEPRLSRKQSYLIDAYALEHDLKRRTAQHHRKKRDPRWLNFIAKREGSSGLESPPENGSASDKPAFKPADYVPEDYTGFPPLLEMEVRTEKLWRKSMEAAERAHATNDLPGISYHTKATGELFRAYRDARAARIKADLEEKKLIPYTEFVKFAEVFQALIQLIHYRPNELAEKANPEHPEVALAALREWEELRFNPAAREFHDFIAGLGKPDASADEEGAEASEQPDASGASEIPESKCELPLMGTEGNSEEGGEA